MKVQPRPWLTGLAPYVPGVHAVDDDGSLASNESSLGASAAVADAVAKAVADVHRYPDPLATELRDALAEEHGVASEQVLVGNGSDELIFLLAWAFAAHGGRVLCADPAYRLDEISAVVSGAEPVKVPLTGWRHDLETMAGIEADLAYVVNPHNPTGTVRSHDDIARFVRTCRARIPVVDEAYVDFADDPEESTAMGLAAAGEAVVLRTFSKVHGLAGLRLGYLVADAGVVSVLEGIRAPFSVGRLTQAAGLAALHDRDHRARVRAHTRAYRDRLAEAFSSAGYEVVPSQANFILVLTSDEPALAAHLARHGVSVRPGAALGIPGAVRVSVPTEEGLRRVHHALRR